MIVSPKLFNLIVIHFNVKTKRYTFMSKFVQVCQVARLKEIYTWIAFNIYLGLIIYIDETFLMIKDTIRTVKNCKTNKQHTLYNCKLAYSLCLQMVWISKCQIRTPFYLQNICPKFILFVVLQDLKQLYFMSKFAERERSKHNTYLKSKS